MNFFTIISIILLYLCFGVFTWQFWFLVIIGTDSDNDNDKIEKLANIPLLIFLLFWPISILLILKILYLDKK